MKCVRIKDGVLIPPEETVTWNRLSVPRLCNLLDVTKLDCADCAFSIRISNLTCLYLYKNKFKPNIK